MAFQELRSQLRTGREQAENARRAAASARDRVVRLQGNVDATKEEIRQAEEAWKVWRNAYAAARDAEIRATKAFGAEADPRTAIKELKDQFPILLFPVRIETRYAGGDPPRELLVRIYPDACLIDSFEPLLSDDEWKSARLYWQARWAAGMVEEQLRGAWRLLAGDRPPGRTEWILRTTQPIIVPFAEEPRKNEETDVILVITADPPVTIREVSNRPEISALNAYWPAVWKADGAKEAIDTARAAMVGAVGEQRAAELLAGYIPVNLDEQPAPPLTRQQVDVGISFLNLPNLSELRSHSWSSAARSLLLPERFVLMAFSSLGRQDAFTVVGEPVLSPLVVSPDPSAPEDEQLRHGPDGQLIFPDEMKWMVDFDRAVASGMGFRISLEERPNSYERLIVIGIRLASDEETGRKELESLLAHHRYSRTGLAVVPQGTPTNNTDDESSGHSRTDDSDVSFENLGRGRLWEATAKFSDKADGQWLTELLGVDESAFTTVRNSDRRDQAEARAMNTALWPATLGFWMTDSSLMQDMFDANTIEWTRGYFTSCVSGRGPLPAIRIGDQPYGILPATAHSLNDWFRVGDPEQPDRLAMLSTLLTNLTRDWQWGIVRDFVRPGSSRDLRLSHVGGNGDPHQILLDVLGLHSGSVEFSERREDLGFKDRQPAAAQRWVQMAATLPRSFGHHGPGPRATALAFFMSPDKPIDTPLIDDQPLSETAPIRAYTTDGKNYIHWLARAGSAEALKNEAGFDNKPPALPLLYRLLKRALEHGYADTSPGAGDRLQAQIAAIERLADLPTARLERIFTEHLDCCAYRLDAWVQGLLVRQLLHMRQMSDTAAGSLKGIHLGAYAMVEKLSPDPRNLQTATIDPKIAGDFAGPAPLLSDQMNEGYIHAPSLNQAVAAAVLRNGYISNADGTRPDTFAVNLTSERVRIALSVLEGIRGGQSLGALLGYQFERGLHDRDTVEADKFIFSIRREFPLGSNRLESTRQDGDDVAIDTIEARNVVDGVAMLNYLSTQASLAYPFAGKDRLRQGSQEDHDAITAEVVKLLETYDAVADLALSEGVYQAVMGNYDRTSATLDSLAKGTFPPEPQIVDTPSEGQGITHRVGIHLKTGANPDASPVSGIAPTPRSMAEPAVNVWIASLLPPLDQVACIVRYRDGANAVQQAEITLSQLKLQPADVLELVRDAQEPSATELDERITALVAGEARPDAPVTIAYLEKKDARFSLFELMPLVRHLRRILRAARPLRPTDLARPNDARSDQDAAIHVDKARIERALGVLENRVRKDLADFVASIAATHGDDIVAHCDAWIETLPKRLGPAALFGIPQCGWSFAYEHRRRVFVSVRAKAAEVIDRWTRKLRDHDALIDKFTALPGTAADAERFALLTAAEGTVTTSVTVPLPATPADYRAIVETKRQQFAGRLAQCEGVRDSRSLQVKGLLDEFRKLLPLKPFDLTEVDTKDEAAQCVIFAEDLVRVVNVVIAEADRRITAVKEQLVEHEAAAAEDARAAILTSAAKALLGEEFVIVPEISLAPAQGEAIAAAAAASSSLLGYAASKIELPVDSWLYGVARVRERMRDWEQLVMFAGALGASEPELTPLQLPVIAEDRWMAVDFPPDVRRDVERLLYTAHFSAPFDRTRRQCGLLLDEWTEVIPAATATTGIAMHYDQPNNEAPQAMLLLTPTRTRTAWQWADVFNALLETLDMIKLRAVEPRHLDNTLHGVFLPALILKEWEDIPG